MNSNVWQIRECLKDIAKRIERIEEKNPKYEESRTWKNLRLKQSALYKLLYKKKKESEQNDEVGEREIDTGRSWK